MKRVLKSVISDLFISMNNLYSYFYWNYKGVRITRDCKISTKAKIEKSCSFFDYSYIGAKVVIGKKTYGNRVYLQKAKIGRYCSIGPGVKIGLDEHSLDNYSTHPSTYNSIKFNKKFEPAKIGDDVWLGANAIVLVGVKIGSHAVVAAGAVVTKDIPDYEIWGGVPAKKIKTRKINENNEQSVRK